jgi:hypothetical protein
MTRVRARWYGTALLAAAVMILGGCRPDGPPIEKTLLVRLPPAYIPETTVFSEDGTAWAFVQQADGREQVVTAAGTSNVHDKAVGLAFAPKSHRLFYWTRDGLHEATKIGIVADGTPIATDFLANGQLGFATDGTRWFAAGAAPPAEQGTIGDITLFVDGAAALRHRDLAMPSFSLDGKHVAWLTATDRRSTLVVDGVVARTFDVPTAPCAAAALASVPSPDMPLRHLVKYLPGGRLLVVTRDADGWGVYLDDERIASYPVSFLDDVSPECSTAASFSPRSLRTAEAAAVAVWWERVAGEPARWRVARNGRPFDAITCVDHWKRHPPEPSADGERVIYPCIEQDATGVQHVNIVHDGKRYGPYQSVWGLAPVASGAHVAYGAQRGTEQRSWGVYVDGEMRAGPFTSVWRPRVSDDGAFVAWEAKPDANARGVFGLNGRTIGEFDEILWGPDFAPDDRVAWIIRRGRSITRISVPLAVAREPDRTHRVVRR